VAQTALICWVLCGVLPPGKVVSVNGKQPEPDLRGKDAEGAVVNTLDSDAHQTAQMHLAGAPLARHPSVHHVHKVTEDKPMNAFSKDRLRVDDRLVPSPVTFREVNLQFLLARFLAREGRRFEFALLKLRYTPQSHFLSKSRFSNSVFRCRRMEIWVTVIGGAARS